MHRHFIQPIDHILVDAETNYIPLTSIPFEEFFERRGITLSKDSEKRLARELRRRGWNLAEDGVLEHKYFSLFHEAI